MARFSMITGSSAASTAVCTRASRGQPELAGLSEVIIRRPRPVADLRGFPRD